MERAVFRVTISFNLLTPSDVVEIMTDADTYVEAFTDPLFYAYLTMSMEQPADSIWMELQNTVDTALHLPYGTILSPSAPLPPTNVQEPAPPPPAPPRIPPHIPPKPRKPRPHIPDINTLPVYKNIHVAQRVFSWKENDTMSFPTAFPSKNLILGLAFGIDVNHLAIFAQSLRDSGSDAVVILFIDIPRILKKPRFKEVIDRTNLLCVYVDMQKSLRSNRISRGAQGQKDMRHFHPSSIRWILYDRLLNAAVRYRNGIYINQREIDGLYVAEEYPTERRWGSLFEKVLLLDVRDSMFQSDPFALLPTLPSPPLSASPSLFSKILHLNSLSESDTSADIYNSSYYSHPLSYFSSSSLRGALPEAINSVAPSAVGNYLDRFTLYGFSEDLSLPIGSCGWNSAWVRDCFTDNILMLMQDNYIVCSGVSMGYMDVVHVYVHYMSLLLRGM
eukprot:gene34109-41283_t